jgi:hypothetical protein
MVRLTLSVPVLIALAAIAVGCGGPSRGAAVPADGGGERARDAFARVPLMFVENRAQSDVRVRFQAQGPGQAFFLTRRQIALMLQQDSGKGVALSPRFLGADAPVALTGAQRAPGTVNYLLGDDPARWRTGVPGYFDGDTIVASQFRTSTLPTTRMWWRVRANDGSGAPGAWSAVRRVEVKR